MNGMMLVYHELEWMWEEAAVVYLKHYPSMCIYEIGKLQSNQQITGLIFELRISRTDYWPI